MQYMRHTARRTEGFTLIELLAVIAIIGILAAIVVPNVTRYIARANVAKAVSEIRNAETAAAGMLSDTGRSNFKDFLVVKYDDSGNLNENVGLGKIHAIHQDILAAGGQGSNFRLGPTAEAIQEALDFYTEMFYELNRQGRDSEWADKHLVPGVRQKLGTSYMPISQDPWGNPYQFWIGAKPRGLDFIVLRSYRINPSSPSPDDPDFIDQDAYRWDGNARRDALAEIPGQPPADNKFFDDRFGYAAYGYPAPKDLPIYIFSKGPNLVIDAMLPIQLIENTNAPEFYGGGDDINSWDKDGAGWENAPR